MTRQFFTTANILLVNIEKYVVSCLPRRQTSMITSLTKETAIIVVEVKLMN